MNPKDIARRATDPPRSRSRVRPARARAGGCVVRDATLVAVGVVVRYSCNRLSYGSVMSYLNL